MDDQSVIPDVSMMRPELVVSDIVYNPRETKLLKEAKEAGCKVIPGIGMLLWQGAEAFPPVHRSGDAGKGSAGAVFQRIGMADSRMERLEQYDVAVVGGGTAGCAAAAGAVMTGSQSCSDRTECLSGRGGNPFRCRSFLRLYNLREKSGPGSRRCRKPGPGGIGKAWSSGAESFVCFWQLEHFFSAGIFKMRAGSSFAEAAGGSASP